MAVGLKRNPRSIVAVLSTVLELVLITATMSCIDDVPSKFCVTKARFPGRGIVIAVPKVKGVPLAKDVAGMVANNR
jgi:hypothetical protein